MKIQGMITKGVGGLYTVLCEDGTEVQCPARGAFRHAGETPMAGDRVAVEPEENGAVLSEILPRKNATLRPPVANLDQLLMVVSMKSPVPNALVLDRLIALAECKGIRPALVFTKADLASPGEWLSLYRKAGFPCLACNLKEGITTEGVPVPEALSGWFDGKLTVLCGNSGAGKTTLLSLLLPGLELQTGEVSKKLGRGRHTTRQVELYPAFGGYIADTPGFSSWDAESGELMTREVLPLGFREFEAYEGQCRFTDCRHRVEKGCAIRKAVKDGEIAQSRYESYCSLYDEVRYLQDWQLEQREHVIRG